MSGGVGNGGGAVKILEDFLKSIRGCPVMVKLNSGIDYKGILACLDGYMDIAMEQTKEYVTAKVVARLVEALPHYQEVIGSRWDFMGDLIKSKNYFLGPATVGKGCENLSALNRTLSGGVGACRSSYIEFNLTSPFFQSKKKKKEEEEEYVNGQLKNKYGDAFIRGKNGVPSNSISSIFFPVLSGWMWFKFWSPLLWMQFSISAPQKGLLWKGHEGAAMKF